MDFESFVKEMEEGIISALPESYKDATVSVKKVVKDNGLELTGLTVRRPDSNVAPTVYLEDVFKDVFNRKLIPYALKEVAEIIVKNDIKSIDVSDFREFEKVKSRIIPCLVNKERNKEVLNKTSNGLVYRNLLDLAIIYKVIVDMGNVGTGSVKVTNQMIDSWGISEETLYEEALKNLEASQFMIRPVSEIVAESMDLEDLPSAGIPDLYVLTNHEAAYAAAHILNKEALKKAEELVGEEFFILPSSVHEFLLVPLSVGATLSALEDMVHEVNRTQVAPKDFLSDTVYYYEKEKGFIEAKNRSVYAV